MTCEYFTRYGNDLVPGECRAKATLELHDNATYPLIKVCHLHARVIVARYPTLGDVATRFRPVSP